ncbi:MAG: primosomal protein N' [Propionibacteriaceae bacterium]|jgi:primosomal protein N' (replication factor Y)|nr:primosomal protein N' [Propionibacteriaceae bacterium]
MSRVVAQVALDVPLAHLDRFFDYEIPETLLSTAALGVRVKVNFAARLRTGFIVALGENSTYQGKLSKLTKIVSPVPVLLPEQITLLRAVADHYAGTFADVVRLAVPPRHATTERITGNNWPQPFTATTLSGGLTDYPTGASWLAAIASGRSPRACWLVDPGYREGNDWTRGIVQACQQTVLSGRGVLVVVPDIKTLRRCFDAVSAALGAGAVAMLHSELGAAERYRNYLALARGHAKVVIGSRQAGYAPVTNLGLIVVVDDGDDRHAEPHAPYPHSRDVAALRVIQSGAALLLVSATRSVEVQAWVEQGWVSPIEHPAQLRRSCGAQVRAQADSAVEVRQDAHATARLPRLVFETLRAGLSQGPVLVQVARAGYVPALRCTRCRTPVHCAFCQGPCQLLRLGNDQQLSCGWCGREQQHWQCRECGCTTLRATAIGATRTAEELGKAFPNHQLVDSSGTHVITEVGSQPVLVVATPGAEPFAAKGYAAAVVLDADRMLARPALRTAEEVLRCWLNLCALVRPTGQVMIAGNAGHPTIQALIRCDPVGFAARELLERREAHLPPVWPTAELTGQSEALTQFMARLVAPNGSEVLGPVYTAQTARAIVRANPGKLAELVAQLRQAAVAGSAANAPGAYRIAINPVHFA